MASGKRQLHDIRSGIGRGGRRPGQTFAISLAMVAFAPLWLFVGYPLERTWGRTGNGSRFAFQVTRHPIAIALSAPMRFLADRAGRVGRFRRGDGGESGPPSAGDREPRRPKPTLPSDAIALGEPRG
ncbi:hypothetical protein ABIA32_002288 [Streptacidiphilus sp. MAP12-20]|uniref:hypothetical protein n=1 Tax=Streptacidiphilus sp. MAP12-20 TaxID=3156299 RepID=UPI003519CC2C